ncbi:MAG: thioredoxin domain-containing protein, partial [Gemmatimonadota bacterium]
DRALLSRATGVLLARFDHRNGGFGGAPKFPQPMLLEFLLGQHVRMRGIASTSPAAESARPSGEVEPLDAALHTLRAMARGGMRDHLAGGFHRYAVDTEWRVPHFEKMLYDNALLARAYLRAFQVTGDDEMRGVTVQTLEYLLTDLRTPEGAFYAARDADSEGEEGRYYVWTWEELEEVLGEEDAAFFARSYGVTREGNWEGNNILIPGHGPVALAREAAVPVGEFGERIARCRTLLLERRVLREPPLRDSKILAAWNGLTLRALAEAGAALDEPRFVEAARTGMEYLLEALRPGDDRLLHQVPQAEGRRIPAYLDDLAALANACLSLHEVTLERRWLEEGIRMAGEIETWFRDPDSGLMFDTPSDGEPLVVRPRSVTDTPTPAGPSLAAELFLRLGTIMGSSSLLRTSRDLVEPLAGGLTSMPDAFGYLLGVADAHLHPPIEIALVPGDQDPPPGRGNGTAPAPTESGDLEGLLRETHRPFLPGRVVSGRHPGEPGAPPSPLLQDRPAVGGRAAAYVCRHHACRRPVTTVPELRAALEDAAAP